MLMLLLTTVVVESGSAVLHFVPVVENTAHAFTQDIFDYIVFKQKHTFTKYGINNINTKQ